MRSPGGDDGRRYRIVRRLGHGGMAEVFEAVLSGTHGFTRRVAIKRISTRAADDPEMAERFLDEARIASQLHHAGIVGVLDYGFVDGLPFQVLEFVDGLDADQLLDRAGGKLPADIALMITADVAHALDHAHRARDAAGIRLGIVHRDVKPANVLVSWDGDVKLSDFGIAFARGRVAVTEAGVARGTPWFMAPEQRTKSEVGPRTDVFALGCTLHALLTGRSPLVDFEVAMRVISGEPAPLAPELPADLRPVIARACAPAPEQRFADCAALADALGPLIAVRLDRDGRGRMREFLTGVRKPAPTGGLLDQLLGVDLVLADDPAAGVGTEPALAGDRAPAATREFTLRATQPAGSVVPGSPPPMPGLLPVAPPAEAAPAPAPVPAPPPTSDAEPDGPPRRRVGVWLAAAILVAGGAATLAIALGRNRGTATSPDAGAGPIAAVALDAAARATPTLDAAMPVPVIDAAVDPTSILDARPDRRRHGDATPTATPRPDAAEAPPPAGVGYVVVSGKGMVRAQILIDGKPRGYAPNPIDVPLGRHQLEVVKSDGTRIGPKSIEVTAYHTLSHPLRP